MELSAQDGKRLDRKNFVKISCPGCGSSRSEVCFQKNHFFFETCLECNTLFCNPRPSESQLKQLYMESESSHYWSNVFFPSVQDARRERLFRPKAIKIGELIRTKGLQVSHICDVGAGHGLFLEELKQVFSEVRLCAIEPDQTSSEILERKGFDVLRAVVQDAQEWKEKFDFVICSEVIEHVFDVKEFLRSLFELLRPGGHCLVTGLGYEGFDILTLQERSKSVSPPHHLNFLSQKGFQMAFKRNGFSSVEIETPGLLDLDIVLNSSVPSPFAQAIKSRGPEAITAFQKFLQENKLSSHVWILAKK